MRTITCNVKNLIRKKTSSKGNQEKHRIGDEWIKVDYLGYEAAAEYLCSEILKNTNVSRFVPYSIEQFCIRYYENADAEEYWENRSVCCVSHDFLQEKELVTFDRLFQKQTGDFFYRATENMPLEKAIILAVDTMEKATGLHNVGKYFTKLLEFDAFVLNEDRHINNIAFVRDEKSFEFCPVFDNGAAFLSDEKHDYPLYREINGLVKSVQAKPFCGNFEKQVRTLQNLYGTQLVIYYNDLQYAFDAIGQYYDEKIVNRIKKVYEIQLEKCSGYITIKNMR